MQQKKKKSTHQPRNAIVINAQSSSASLLEAACIGLRHRKADDSFCVRTAWAILHAFFGLAFCIYWANHIEQGWCIFKLRIDFFFVWIWMINVVFWLNYILLFKKNFSYGFFKTINHFFYPYNTETNKKINILVCLLEFSLTMYCQSTPDLIKTMKKFFSLIFV